MKNHVLAEVRAGAWKLPKNDIWNIPEAVEKRFEYETGARFHKPIVSLSALAITLDGRVFGHRRMTAPRESGYNMEGRVSIGGKKYRAFTSSKLFEREDGLLCEVAVLVVCNYKPIECKYRKAARVLRETGKKHYFLSYDPAPGDVEEPCGRCDACQAEAENEFTRTYGPQGASDI